MCKVKSIQKLVKKLIKNSSENLSITHQKNLITKFVKKLVKTLSKKIVKQDPRGKQVPFMSPQSGFQEAPHASQGGNQLKKCSGINNNS